jgi:hypothetical protein
MLCLMLVTDSDVIAVATAKCCADFLTYCSILFFCHWISKQIAQTSSFYQSHVMMMISADASTITFKFQIAVAFARRQWGGESHFLLKESHQRLEHAEKVSCDTLRNEKNTLFS